VCAALYTRLRAQSHSAAGPTSIIRWLIASNSRCNCGRTGEVGSRRTNLLRTGVAWFDRDIDGPFRLCGQRNRSAI